MAYDASFQPQPDSDLTLAQVDLVCQNYNISVFPKHA